MPFPLVRIGHLSAALLCCACSVAPETPTTLTQPGEVVRSSKPRLTAAAPPADTEELTAGNAAFGLDLLDRTAGNDNFFFSPHSLSLAIAMTYAGARERTATQMADALHFTLPPDRFHAAFGSLDLELAGRSSAPVSSGQAFKLNVINALWGQRGYTFLSPYLDLLAEDYGAGLSLLDFNTDPDGSRATINRWVSDQTESRIPELIPPGVVTPMTVLVLTNAIYFNASWADRFDPGDTRDGPFVTIGGASVTAHLMHQARNHRYADGDGWQALELLYAGYDVSMLLLLPAEGAFEQLRARLDGGLLSSIVGALGTRMVDATVPRFQFRTELAVKPVLQALGMKDAFEANVADLSGMDGTRNLFIEDVVHQAFVSVNEEGTEAAAATAVVVGTTGMPAPATFTANRPFLFVIRDNPTGAVLFIGQVTSP